MILALLACVGGGPDDSGEPADTGPVDVDDLAGEAACGQTRFLADGAEFDVAITVPLELLNAASTGSPARGTYAIGDEGVAAYAERAYVAADLCGSIEEFPPVSVDDYWAAASGSFTFSYQPIKAWGSTSDPWTYDGTVDGTVTVEVEGLVLEPRGEGGETVTIEIAEATWDAGHSATDLPA